jgi:hypothetical protein
VGVPARLVPGSAHHTAALQGPQGAVYLFAHHRSPPTPAAMFGDRDACSAGRGEPVSVGQHLNQVGA